MSKLRTISYKISKRGVRKLWRSVMETSIESVSVNHVVSSIVSAIEYAKFRKAMTAAKAQELQDYVRKQGRGVAAYFKNQSKATAKKIVFKGGEGFVHTEMPDVGALREKYLRYKKEVKTSPWKSVT
eukprot:GEMP01139137.1.p1 GENE.GEMP01139137.1~~GEMP01139137.1.p1  ORF type:complete len:127 (+),score=24.63 GEMP01139137.1:52-432(+)